MIIRINNEYIKIKVADTFSKRLFGLMGKRTFDYCLMFYNCNSIHTFFMKEDINIIGIDLNNRVIYKEFGKRNKIFKIKNTSKNTSVLELPISCEISNIKIGDVLVFENEDII